MKEYLHLLDYVLWLATIAGQWLLFAYAVRKRIARLAPRFLLFLGFICFQSTALFAVARALSYPYYFWSYYAGLAIETLLLMLVLYDIFRTTFQPYFSLPSRTLGRLVTSIAVISALVISLAIWKPALSADAATSFLRTFHRTSGLVVALSLWSVVMYARHVGVPWRSRTAGIAAGFLFYLSVQGLTTAAIGFAPQAWFAWLDRAGNAAFLLSLVSWFHAVRQPEEISLDLPAPEFVFRLRGWVAQMRRDTGELEVAGKARWRAE